MTTDPYELDVDVFLRIPTPEEFVRQCRVESNQRVVNVARYIFSKMLATNVQTIKVSFSPIRVTGFVVSLGLDAAETPKSDEEWQELVARIQDAGWQCKMEKYSEANFDAYVWVAAPGEEFIP